MKCITPFKARCRPDAASRKIRAVLLVLISGLFYGCPPLVDAADAGSSATAASDIERVQAAGEGSTQENHAIYGQITNVTQWHSRFRSPYMGENSLDPNGRTEETTDITLFAGLRLGAQTEFWINPEVDQGFGLSNTLGVAGFPSGEAYKIGSNAPYVRVPRAFVRHAILLGGPPEKIDAAPNQLGGAGSADKVTLTIGKFSAVDVFDTNRYAHDPRADFMNWSVIDAGAFDYAADAWGFTFGAAAELVRNWWTLRGGVFQLSETPNGKVAGLHPHQHMLVTELEMRYACRARPGKFKLLAFVNRANMANYRDAVHLARESGTTPDVSLVRRYQSRPGIAVNLEQELASDLGFFLRASANDGSKEAYEFTEINKSLAAGLSLQGSRWGRGDDTVGVAGVVNSLSNAAREYFSAGGMGILIGDGQLRYTPEKIIEAYYALRMRPNLTVTFDYQHVNNPAYNADRGPVSIYGVRMHAEF